MLHDSAWKTVTDFSEQRRPQFSRSPPRKVGYLLPADRQQHHIFLSTDVMCSAEVYESSKRTK